MAKWETARWETAKWEAAKWTIATLHGKPTSELNDVTCYPTQVNVPRLTPAR